jgi:peptidyl-prolyl cis-trans isomerase SurA
VTSPIRTRQGFVILKVTEHQAAGVPPLKDVEPQVQEALYMQAMQPALREYLTKLREEAYIDIKPGFVDSGASPRQTKPVFTAYTPPVSKKEKKKEEKQRFERTRYTAASKTTPTATPAVATAGATSAGTTTATAATSATATTTPAKPKKIKREKIRYGQAPRNALPAGEQKTSEGAGAGEASTTTQTADAGAAVAPGTAIAPTQSTTMISPTSDADPLAPKAANTGKTRYSDRAKTEAADKAAKKATAQKEKLAATPAAPTADELATEKAQAAPLGLNGDTATKKKPKKVKGAQKERLQNKDTTPAPPPAPPAPTVNPSLGATPSGLTPNAPAPSAPATPPAPQPAPPPANPQN